MKRLFSIFPRLPNVVNIMTPRVPGVEGYRLKWAENFDQSPQLLLTSTNIGFLDPNVDRQKLSVQPLEDQIRIVFDPASYGIPDGIAFWMQFVTVTNGVEGTPGAMTLVLPASFISSTGLILIAGTPIGTQQLDLPLMRDFNFQCDADIEIGTEDGGATFNVPGSTTETHSLSFLGSLATIYVSGGAFSMSARLALGVDLQPSTQDGTSIVPTPSVPGQPSVMGTSTEVPHADHRHGLPPFGEISGTFAEGDDERLSDDRVASGLRTAAGVVSVSTAAAPSAGQVLTAQGPTAASWTTVAGGGGVTSTIDPLGSIPGQPSAIGTSDEASRADHAHEIPIFGSTAGAFAEGNDPRLFDDRTSTGLRTAQQTIVSTVAADTPATNAVLTATSSNTATWKMPLALSNVAPAAVKPQTASAGASPSASRLDHLHDVVTAAPAALLIASTVVAGTAASLSRSDHVHAMPGAGTPVALTLAGASAAGSAATLARSDHVHALPATAAALALTVGGASAVGSAATLARSDHLHGLPPFGSSAGNLVEGVDPRLSNDRTASGVRTASSVVVVSAAVAPSAGQALVASGPAAASWASVSATIRDDPATEFDVGDKVISNALDPVGPQDVATRAYVDAAIAAAIAALG